MRKYIQAILMSAILAAPVVIQAEEHHRYYDRDHKDWHEWNEGEQRAFRHWVVDERHRTYHEWNKANRAEQRDYWRWRHEHSDWH